MVFVGREAGNRNVPIGGRPGNQCEIGEGHTLNAWNRAKPLSQTVIQARQRRILVSGLFSVHREQEDLLAVEPEVDPL